MKLRPQNILHITLPTFVLSMMFFVEPTSAGSVIRIIGDKASTATDTSHESTTAGPSPSYATGNGIIRIIGDKEKITQIPEQRHTTGQDDIVKGTTITPDEIQPQDATDQQMAQRLEAIKSDEERKAAEKAKQERQAQLQAVQEDERKRQIDLKQEQERKAAQIAEETRKIAEKAEQEKIAAEKAEHERIVILIAEAERLASAKKAFIEKPASPPKKTAPSSSIDSYQTGSDQAIKPAPLVKLPETGFHSSRPDNSSNAEFIPLGTNNDQAPESIWDLYLSAKANDPVLGRTESRVTGSKADSDVIFSGFLPHVDSSAGLKQISQTLSNYTPNDVNNDFTALNYNVSARMTLLNMPAIYSLSAAAASLRSEQAGVLAARQNLIVKFSEAYFSLLKAQTDKQIALGEINRLKRVLDQSHAFLNAGTGDIIAVYEAQSRLDGAVADLTKSESTLRLAEQKLSTVVGKPVTSIVNHLPQQPVGPDPDNLEWWVTTMEQEQPLLRQAREGLSQTLEQRKAVKAEYLPVVQATGGYDVNRGTAALPSAEVRQWFVGASISLPLYSGGETSAKVRRAVASEEERRHIFDETMDQQRENVKQSFFNLRYNFSFIKALEQKKASAEIQLSAVSKGRNIGTRNAIDVLNAEQAYSVALRDYKYALYDNIIRGIQLKSAAGILTEADISEVSKTAPPTLTSGLR